MKRLGRIVLILAAAFGAGWWLFYLTPTRGGRQADEIRFGFWGDYQEYQMWQRIVGAFRAEHPDIRVKMEYVPADYRRKLTAWMASDSSPEVMLLQDEPFPRYIADSRGPRPVLAELTALTAGERFGPSLAVRREDYWPTAWQSFCDPQDDRRQFGLPVFGGNNLIFYNRECFRLAGIPLPEESGVDQNWTIESFVDLCRRLTIRQEVAGQTRTVQWGFSRPWGWLYWLPFFYAFDAEILSDDRQEFIFTGPEAMASLRFAHALYGEHRVVPRGADLGPMSENVAFLTGKVAMITSGPWAMPFFNEAKLDYGVMFPPVSPTGRRGTRITWDGVGLAGRLERDPARLEQAWKLARFLASARSAEIVGQARRSIPAHRAGTAAFVAADKDGQAAARAAKFIEALEFSRVQPITLQWDRMDEILLNGMGELTRAAPGGGGQDDSSAVARRALGRIVRDIAADRLFALPAGAVEDRP